MSFILTPFCLKIASGKLTISSEFQKFDCFFQYNKTPHSDNMAVELY